MSAGAGLDVLIVANERFRFASVNPLDLAEVLARQGLSVEVAAPFDAEAAAWNAERGFDLHVLPHRQNARFWRDAVLHTRARRPRVVIGVNPVGLVAADLACSLGYAQRFVYYALELSLPVDFPRSASVRWQALRAKKAALVVTTGRERAVVMSERFGLGETPEVVANSPLAAAAPPEPDGGLRAALGVAGPIAVYAGSLGAPNRIRELVAAASLWRSDTTLALHGFGGSEEERAELTGAAADARSRGRVVMLPEVPGSRETLIRWLSGADLGIAFLDPRVDPTLNVRYYTPNKLFDYLAAGLPVVTSDNPNLVHEVALGGLGQVVDPSRPEAIAAAIDAVVADLPGLKARVRSAFSHTFAYEVQAQRVVARIAALCRA